MDKKTCPDGLNPMLGILPIHHLFGKDALLILEGVSFFGGLVIIRRGERYYWDMDWINH